MAEKVRMPRVDANVDEGTVGKWLVRPGQVISPGHPLCEIITDKAAFELEARCDGVFREAVVSERSVVPVGYVIALVGADDSEEMPDVADENAAIMRAYQESLLSGERPPVDPGAGTPEAASGGVRATPAARMLASREGVSLDALASRVRGVIQKADVEQAVQRRRGGTQ
jgi:pyruvate dehydrogenase E2 component (dihydrolipoamide acetyltransferase)